MKALRWVLLVPVSVAALMLGSLAGGMVGSILGAADTGSAFVGPFAFVFAATAVAPVQRRRVALWTMLLFFLMALGTFVFSTFTSLEAFADLPPNARVTTPVAQVLGALYAAFLSLPIVTPNTPVERLWREMVGLGAVVVQLGLLLTLAGVVAGALGHGWLGVRVALFVLAVGAASWLFPFLAAARRAQRVAAPQ